MSITDLSLVKRMMEQLGRWEFDGDRRADFLACYCMMTRNMAAAVDQGEFRDPVWVDLLLHRFANFYFLALSTYDREPEAAPQVWQIADQAARDPRLTALQRLLLGVSAHINYDLVFTLVELLGPGWANSSTEDRAARYDDYCHVNATIGLTIDAVQDQVLEPAMSSMRLLDQILGGLDELLISRLISGWRQSVWQSAIRLLEAPDADERARIAGTVEARALDIAHSICPLCVRTPDI